MSKQLQDAYIVAATRTPIGKAARGMFRNVRPDDLLVRAIQSAVAQVPGLDVKLIEDAIVGCSFPEASRASTWRACVLLAGLPKSWAVVTVNRYCASGITAIAMAADRIRVGQAEVMIAAGVESMSMVPMMGYHPSRTWHFQGREHRHGIRHGPDAEKVAQQWKITREAQDEFSLKSHQKAIAAQLAGEFKDETTSVDVVERFPTSLPARSTSRRAGSMRTKARAPTPTSLRWRSCGRCSRQRLGHRGNSFADLGRRRCADPVSEKILKQFNLTPLARFVSFAVGACRRKSWASARKESDTGGVQGGRHHQDQIDWFELNEAFAAQSLAVMQDLGLDPAKVNPMGGAIALGHPLGATGAIRSGHGDSCPAAQKPQVRHGDMCVGTGMGAAGIFERV